MAPPPAPSPSEPSLSTAPQGRGPQRLVTTVSAVLLWSGAATLAVTSFTDHPPAGPAPAAPAAALSASGSPLDQAFLTRAVSAFEHQQPQLSVAYRAAGPGGSARLRLGTVNFAVTDVPAAQRRHDSGSGAVVQVPVELAGEAVAYNVRGAGDGLRLSGAVLAQIFLGRVAFWDAPALAALDPGVHLPHEPITVVRQPAASAAASLFSGYLASVSPLWRAEMGSATVRGRPTGLDGADDQDVARLVERTPGAIGYLDLAQAAREGLAVCRVRNAAGVYVAPSASSVAAAAAAEPQGGADQAGIVDAPGAGSYPVSGYSWAVAYKHQRDESTGRALARLLEWLTHGGQRYAAELDDVPLPAEVRRLAERSIAEMTGPGGQPLVTSRM